MKDKYYKLILEKYQSKKSDFSGLFQAVLSIGDEVGLEKCVIEKRLEGFEWH